LAAQSFKCRVVTPDRKLLDEELTYASLPAWDGLMGILPGRAPLLAKLGVGELRVRYAVNSGDVKAGGERSIYIEDGFVQMANNTLTILAERAVPVEEIVVGDAEAELKEAEARRVPDDARDRAGEAEKVRAAREHARVKLRLAKSNRGKGL
jgi:F-type H+-transporting ATPase subunit epsilon